MGDIYDKFEVTATDKEGKRVTIFLTPEKILPGNGFTKTDADGVAADLHELLHGILVLDLHG